MDIGVKIHGCPKIIRFTLVYPGVSTGRVSFQWWERPCSPCAETPETASAAWRWQGATAVVAVLKSFQRQSQTGAVPWSSIRHLMIFVYRCSILSSSTGSMDIGAPDRSSRFQWMLDVAFPSSIFPWSSRVVISGASLSWSTQHVLWKHPVLEFIHIFDICRGDSSWTPMSQCEEWEKCFYALNHHLSNSASEYWSILCIEGCQFGCQQCSGNAPVDLVREERQTELVNLLMDKASWLHGWDVLDRCLLAVVGLKHCSGRQWPKDVNFNGYTLW